MASATKKRSNQRKAPAKSGGSSWLMGMFWRFLASTATVMLTYNPSGYSFYHWVKDDIMNGEFDLATLSIKIFAFLGLLIPWVVIGIATKRSLGFSGILLVVAFFVAGISTLVLNTNVDINDATTLAWITVVILSIVLTIGLSWSLIRRRITGQLDVDTVDGDEHHDDDYHH